MDTATHSAMNRSLQTFSFERVLYVALMPLPVPFINFILNRLIKRIGNNRPEIFDRLEGHHQKRFLIDPLNLPFVFYLRPDPVHPELKSFRKNNIPKHDGSISGSFLTLLGMIDGRYDGDALFFTRDLCIKGDTEAVVCLRNALDNVEGSIADDVASFFGKSGQRVLKVARKVSNRVHRK